ncbi:hypothetical protein LXM25_25830 [Dyadobacter sp. LJ53]|uniref:DUF6934 family protein n=1 Tax=Dyadobacter chenwenxiniae TaxID=2906456 RepID=UPI001F43C565|nr:hypothetical protein [Dyadobacter chenwenxiniae]MCF0053518.1 hypothetical protein [Dyadobacter chenwenxiniae]
MKANIYAVSPHGNGCWKFVSEGRRGRFEVRILFTRDFSEPDHKLYNLGFGVWNPLTREIDDSIEVRNGDMDRILATVGVTALNFLELNPDSFIYAEGSTAARTRKYQMGIAAYLADIPDIFRIKGLLIETKNGQLNPPPTWEPFRVGVNYRAFLLHSNVLYLK